MKKTFKLLFSMLLFVSLVGLMSGCSKVTDGDFSLWQKEAPALTALTDYMTEITDLRSENYIPPEDRIAVFDLDGTLYGEKAPTYAIWQTFVHRALEDDAYEAPEDVRAVAEQVKALTPDSTIPDHLEKAEAEAEVKAFAGMSVIDHYKYVQKFLSETDATGFDHLKLSDAFYQPMIQIIDYLQKNDFKVYICSGTDRFWVRAAIKGVLPIPPEQVIGMDYTIVASGQGDADGLEYNYTSKDDILRGDQLLIKNVKMNKVIQIGQEIGRQPVLAFGNSSGDSSMLTFVTNENPYKSMSFMVLADDTEREYGNPEKAEKMKVTCDQNGWQTISMKNDWLTIYGDQVTKK